MHSAQRGQITDLRHVRDEAEGLLPRRTTVPSHIPLLLLKGTRGLRQRGQRKYDWGKSLRHSGAEGLLVQGFETGYLGRNPSGAMY